MDRLILGMFFLVVAVFGQSGGGGGSSSGYSSSDFLFYRRSPTCQDMCFGNIECINRCGEINRNYGAAVIFTTLGVILSVCLGCFLCRLKCCRGAGKQFMRHQAVKPEPNTMPPSEYLKNRDQIITMINQSESNNNFGYEQEGQKYPMQAKAEIMLQQEGNTQVQVKGRDHLGSWVGYASIYCKQGRMFLWMYKEYDDRDLAGQTEEREHLIYQSTSYDPRTGMEGKFYYPKLERANLYENAAIKDRGIWKLWPPNLGDQMINPINEYSYPSPNPTPYPNQMPAQNPYNPNPYQSRGPNPSKSTYQR